MGILEIEIVKGFMRMCNDGWLQGWHERNGGNLTYRMKEEEVAQCRPFFDPQPREWVNMGVQADNLAGEYFITTGSGKFFRNVEPDPVHSIGIVEINDKGDSWRIVWGLEDGAKPTSEFPRRQIFARLLHILALIFEDRSFFEEGVCRWHMTDEKRDLDRKDSLR